MNFLNLIQHRTIVILFREFITNLTSFSLNLYFSEPLSGGYGCCQFAVAMFVYAYDGICDFVWCYDHLNIEFISEHRFLTHNTLQMMFIMLNLLIIKNFV